jgi:hypothetical protein
MSRRGRGEGNLFGGAEPQDAIPELEDLIRGSGRSRPPRSRSPRPVGQLRYAAYTKGRPGVRRGILVFRLVLAGGLLALGLLMVVAGSVEAADGYSRAGSLASAPACPASVDPTSTTEDCVGNVTLLTDDGAYDDGGDEAVDLYRPPESAYDYFFPSFPGDQQFYDAVNAPLDAGASHAAVRAEFWEGNVVELTAGQGAGAVTVTTDANPNNQGGTALGTALMGVCFAELGLLLLYAVRAVRLRWLRPGLKLRLFVTTLSITALGLFVASICLINQPARAELTLIIAPSVTLVVLLAVGALETSYWFGLGRSRRRTLPAQRRYRGR